MRSCNPFISMGSGLLKQDKTYKQDHKQQQRIFCCCLDVNFHKGPGILPLSLTMQKKCFYVLNNSMSSRRCVMLRGIDPFIHPMSVHRESDEADIGFCRRKYCLSVSTTIKGIYTCYSGSTPGHLFNLTFVVMLRLGYSRWRRILVFC